MASQSDQEKGEALRSAHSTGSESGEAPATGNWRTRFVDSFRRDPNASVINKAVQGVDPREYDHKTAAERTANSGLAHKLKGRHLQMIAIGGSIGTLCILM